MNGSRGVNGNGPALNSPAIPVSGGVPQNVQWVGNIPASPAPPPSSPAPAGGSRPPRVSGVSMGQDAGGPKPPAQSEAPHQAAFVNSSGNWETPPDVVSVGWEAGQAAAAAKSGKGGFLGVPVWAWLVLAFIVLKKKFFR